ncbi:MAG: 2-hydroxyacyl-CoA dehydratase family protein [Desulfatiglans sp.]|jgi:benzoyl-CoA reductase subunit C|nr:2-hydroxyacyl-CoA dehydratase family protein [Thermodesulfobacteriota bacterium]MEE4354673.1 2-hydroxyacyl-CoA dehydratase family protein [Desulfatiglans sp.]
MENALARIVGIATDPYSYVTQLKEERNSKVIGCFPMHIPEEIIHAADLLPVVIWRGDEPVTWGHSHVRPYNCGILRSFVDDAVKGKLSFMDGMVFHIRQCLPAQEPPLIMERNLKLEYKKILYMPPVYPGEAIRDFLVEDLKSFQQSLEDYTGKKIGDDKLRESIEVYNRNRDLMERVYAIRREKPDVLKASLLMKIVFAGMVMPKEDHNVLLSEIIEGMEATRGEIGKGKLKVVPVGCLCQTPPFEVLDMIEDLGMIMPDDDLFVGSRYFANKVDHNGSPIEGLADRYLSKVPVCATKGIWDVHWGDEVIKKVKEVEAKGVISVLAKFCPPHTCYYPDFKNKLVEEGVPEVLIQVEHEMISLEGIKTRLQSFAESIGGV